MPSVGKWRASYHCNTKKSWIYGSFEIFPQFLQFCEESETDIIDFKIYFDEFVELKKESTNVFYTALTIRTNDNKYWFSSFPSCTNVYNILEHFWRERLFASSKTKSSPHDNSRAQEMLRILHDSADCLSSTSRTLEAQGQQIDGACRTMNKLHNDLGVAEKIMHSMDSWLNLWNTPMDDVVISCVPDKPEDSEKLELPILYAPTDKEKHLSGSLVLSKKTIEVLDLQRNPVYKFNAKELSEATVHTPFEVTLIKSEIGKPAVSVHLISAKLVKVIPHIQVMLGPKLSLEEPPDGEATIGNGEDELSQNIRHDAMNYKQSHTELDGPSASNRASGCSKAVSESEASQMAKVLQDMKAMAVGIQSEQNRQLQQLGLLTNSVDKANERLREDVRTINHLS